jgi:hypothetical protein
MSGALAVARPADGTGSWLSNPGDTGPLAGPRVSGRGVG